MKCEFLQTGDTARCRTCGQVIHLLPGETAASLFPGPCRADPAGQAYLARAAAEAAARGPKEHGSMVSLEQLYASLRRRLTQRHAETAGATVSLDVGLERLEACFTCQHGPVCRKLARAACDGCVAWFARLLSAEGCRSFARGNFTPSSPPAAS